MIVTIANVADFEQFLRTFSNEGIEKRREHRRKGACVVRDPDAVVPRAADALGVGRSTLIEKMRRYGLG